MTRWLNSSILESIANEAIRADSLHAGRSMLNPECSLAHRLAVLGEEMGEVCRACTYDGTNRGNLHNELIQLAAMAASWAQCVAAYDNRTKVIASYENRTKMPTVIIE